MPYPVESLANIAKYCPYLFAAVDTLQNEPLNEMSYNVECATSKASDQPALTRSLIRAFACLFKFSMTVRLLTEHHLEFLSLKGSSESTLVKIHIV